MAKQLTVAKPATPKYVKIAPGDSAETLPAIFFQDPRTYNPPPGPLGQVHAWGLYAYEPVKNFGPEWDNWPSYDIKSIMDRKMVAQWVYNSTSSDNKLKTPEVQFVEVLMDRKRKKLKERDLKDLTKCDVILRIWLPGIRNSSGQIRIERRIRVSAGLKLSVFQDKILSPAMGWVRNLHCYIFTDFRDGALFGPEGSNAVDCMHWKDPIGYEYLPDDEFMLAHLIEKEGDSFGYLYDFGDKFYHEIEVIKIFPKEESDGAVRVIDGKGQCPGENMQGNFQYQHFLKALDKASPVEKSKKKREILDQPNFKESGKPPSLFDVDDFDVAAAEARVNAALASPNSVRGGAKQFSTPFSDQAFDEEMAKKLSGRKPETVKVNREMQPETSGFWHETVSLKKDSRKETACAYCGKPGGEDLKQCGGCHLVMYCSEKHQAKHWKTTHRKKCSRQYTT